MSAAINFSLKDWLKVFFRLWRSSFFCCTTGCLPISLATSRRWRAPFSNSVFILRKTSSTAPEASWRMFLKSSNPTLKHPHFHWEKYSSVNIIKDFLNWKFLNTEYPLVTKNWNFLSLWCPTHTHSMFSYQSDRAILSAFTSHCSIGASLLSSVIVLIFQKFWKCWRSCAPFDKFYRHINVRKNTFDYRNMASQTLRFPQVCSAYSTPLF